MASFSKSHEFSLANLEDATAITQLEVNSFPPDEAATPERIFYRIEHARDYFYVLKENDHLIGFINGTKVKEDTIYHESLDVHHPDGKTLVIHSITVDKDYRRQKIASKILQQYIIKISKLNTVHKILLLSKPYLLPFYLSNGFHFIKNSPVIHGEDRWIELGLDLKEYHGVKQWVVDAFAADPFTGNPAAVVLQQKDEKWMQKVAMENNYAETSFVKHIEENIFQLRWFTPAREVELCGHATLAAAHVLYETKTVPLTLPIRFQTVYSGELVATGTPDMTIELSFPSSPVSKVNLSEEELNHIYGAFGFKSSDILFIGKSIYDMVVEVTPKAFYSIQAVNHSLIEKLGGRGFLVTTLGGKRTADPTHLPYDFVTRGFFPLYGINEDPVTGSAHCALSTYWFERFGIQQTADVRTVTLDAFQACPTRGGAIKVSLLNDRTILGGKGITTMTAKILV